MDTAEGITLCLIGCGAMGGIHARHLAQDTRVGHLILCEAEMERAELLAKDLGPRGPTTEIISPDQAFDARSTDGFLIVSPAAQHAEHLRAAAVTDRYVFCEKPVATDPEDIVSLAAELGHVADHVQVGFNRRFDHHLSAFKSRLVAGAIGQIEQLHLASRDHAPPMPEHLPFSAGLIAETMIHDFDTVRWLLDDEIASVTCHGSALINPAYADHGHIDTATTVLIGASEQQVVIQNSWRAPQGYDQRIEALGTAGVLRVENPRNSTVTMNTVTGEATDAIKDDWSTRYVDAYRAEMVAFVDSVTGNLPASPNLRDGLAASTLANFCKEALQTGKTQLLKTE